MANGPLLVGDIGGTNARFALVGNAAEYHSERVFLCEHFASPESAIRAYLDEVGAKSPDVICLAAAGPVIGGRCQLTNNPWELDEGHLGLEFASDCVALINDFTAVAFGLPGFAAEHCMPIGCFDALCLDGDFTVAVLGPGTGLGAGGLVQRGEFRMPLVSEAGHVGFAPETELQRDVLRVLAGRLPRVSCERVLSGAGVQNLYTALCELGGQAAELRLASEIFAHSQTNPTSLARRATDLFFEILGQVAGDLALTLGADDGVFIAGGIAQRYPQMLQASAFRVGFENKGRHRELLERVPTLLISHPHPGLFGAAEHARRLAT